MPKRSALPFLAVVAIHQTALAAALVYEGVAVLVYGAFWLLAIGAVASDRPRASEGVTDAET